MFRHEQIRRRAAAFACGIALATMGTASIAGCGNKSAANDDAEMRKAMTKKNWSVNDVPPEQRARVQALMRQHGAAPR